LSGASVASAGRSNTRVTGTTGGRGLEGLATAGLEPNASDQQRDCDTPTDFEGKHAARYYLISLGTTRSRGKPHS
jgi:hypothetical protein